MPLGPHTERYRQFRELMVERGKKAGLTQSDVANRLSKPQSFVAKYEAGERRLDVVEFMETADAVGFEPVQFIRNLAAGRGSHIRDKT